MQAPLPWLVFLNVLKNEIPIHESDPKSRFSRSQSIWKI